jgi:hypothetical protein
VSSIQSVRAHGVFWSAMLSALGWPRVRTTGADSPRTRSMTCCCSCWASCSLQSASRPAGGYVRLIGMLPPGSGAEPSKVRNTHQRCFPGHRCISAEESVTGASPTIQCGASPVQSLPADK